MDSTLSMIFKCKSAFDDYCNNIKWMLQKSDEMSVRHLVYQWCDEYEKGTQEEKETLEQMFTIMTNYSCDLARQCNEMRIYMCDKIPEYYHDFQNWVGKSENDIVVIEPLERQNNGILMIDNDSIMFDTILKSLIKIRYYTRKLYTYIILYINKLTVHIQYTKSQILILEITRRSINQNTLHPFDCVIQFHMDQYIKLKEVYNKYNRMLCNINIDDIYVKRCYYNDSEYIMCSYYKTYYTKQYDTLTSVIGYS